MYLKFILNINQRYISELYNVDFLCKNIYNKFIILTKGGICYIEIQKNHHFRHSKINERIINYC